MAISRTFAGTTIYKPGGWGMTHHDALRMRLVQFITKLGVKTYMSKWPEYER